MSQSLTSKVMHHIVCQSLLFIHLAVFSALAGKFTRVCYCLVCESPCLAIIYAMLQQESVKWDIIYSICIYNPISMCCCHHVILFSVFNTFIINRDYDLVSRFSFKSCKHYALGTVHSILCPNPLKVLSTSKPTYLAELVSTDTPASALRSISHWPKNLMFAKLELYSDAEDLVQLTEIMDTVLSLTMNSGVKTHL